MGTQPKSKEHGQPDMVAIIVACYFFWMIKNLLKNMDVSASLYCFLATVCSILFSLDIEFGIIFIQGALAYISSHRSQKATFKTNTVTA